MCYPRRWNKSTEIMKKQIKKIIPKPVWHLLRNKKRKREAALNQSRSTEEVFSNIYRNNIWGGERGDFCSGSGTVGTDISKAYLDCLTELSTSLGFSKLRAVDLGCGDMRIGENIKSLFNHYTGVDIVKPLIEAHEKNWGDERTTFEHLDIIEEELPEGDVCFLRQVLQHLSNEQISAILPKLAKYPYVFVTEHLPSIGPDIVKNIDKTQGGTIRLYQKSGVFLTEAPFLVPTGKMEVILEVTGHKVGELEDRGVIQTCLIRH